MITGHQRLLDIVIDVAQLAWMDAGICGQTDPEAFFPEKGGSCREAKATCRECPVIAECRAYGLDDPALYGVWGALTKHERDDIRRREARQAA